MNVIQPLGTIIQIKMPGAFLAVSCASHSLPQWRSSRWPQHALDVAQIGARAPHLIQRNVWSGHASHCHTRQAVE
jgi:hypothetical protein